jgi:hypothetical protein
MKGKNRILNYSLSVIVLLLSHLLQAQNSQLKGNFNQKKWTRTISFGFCAFKSDGLPPSRNQLNYFKTIGETPIEEKTSGFAYDVKLQRKISKLSYVGLSFNGYNDGQERQFYPLEYNVGAILDDSLNVTSIQTFQSYLNIGGVYEHRLFQSKNGKVRVNGSLALGLSINRTPERTEFDYFESDGFVTADTTAQGEWQHISTRFNHGFFIQPNINVRYNLFKNSGFLLEISQIFQWNSSEKQTQIMNVNSHGNIGNGRYTVSAQQFRIGYFF